MRFNKKGYQLKDLAPIAIIILTSVIAISIGAEIVNEAADDSYCASGYVWNETTGACSNASGQTHFGAGGYGANITRNGLTGLGTMGGWMPTIGLVLAASIVIGVLIYSFSMRR